jgi:hypothetical protein
VVQHFFPETEIAHGEVWTGKGLETHFWNVVGKDGTLFHIDLSWQQFPTGSVVKSYALRDRSTLGDSPETLKRVALLLSRLMDHLPGTSQ